MTDPEDVDVDSSVRIPLRDGVRLSAILYRPAREGHAPAPGICTMTPYVAQRHHSHGIYFAAEGYAFLAVDVRGRGDSAGEFHPRNEARDGYDVVEWLARHPRCNGQVAMWGASYLAFCQWRTAAERPPSLTTIVPAAAACYGVDVPMRNNVSIPYTVRWLALLSGRSLQDKLFGDHAFWSAKFRQWFESGTPFRQLDTLVGAPAPLFQEWASHPQQDDYWDIYNPTAQQYAELDVPILTITGAYDGNQAGALEHYRRHMHSASPAARARHFLIIGPWDHAGTSAPKAEFCGLKVGPDSILDLRQLHRDWYAWIMQSGPKPPFMRKNVAYYVSGAEEWRYADSLEAVTARSEPLYLQSFGNPTDVFASGSLAAEINEQMPQASYVYDPREIDHARLESTLDPDSLVDQTMIHARRGRQLIYHSAPLAEDREICGCFRLSAWLSIDQPDTDFVASVYEIGPAGESLLLSIDWMRARYRQSLQEQKLIDTREPLRYDFHRFTFVARRVRRGHRLRLVIGPFSSIHWEKNYNSGGVVADESLRDARPVTVKLFQSQPYASTLYVPHGAADVL
jgi:uncharacterized protein